MNYYPTFPKTVEALEAAGIDPHTVGQDGMTLAGYMEFVLVDGKRVYQREAGDMYGFQAVKRFKPWTSEQLHIPVIYKEEGGELDDEA